MEKQDASSSPAAGNVARGDNRRPNNQRSGYGNPNPRYTHNRDYEAQGENFHNQGRGKRNYLSQHSTNRGNTDAYGQNMQQNNHGQGNRNRQSQYPSNRFYADQTQGENLQQNYQGRDNRNNQSQCQNNRVDAVKVESQNMQRNNQGPENYQPPATFYKDHANGGHMQQNNQGPVNQSPSHTASNTIKETTKKIDATKDEELQKRDPSLTFEIYEKKYRKQKIDYVVVTEREADLFEMDNKYSLANCVAEDMNMGSGIAITFRTTFKGVEELLAQRKKQGNVAYLNRDDRYIYYMVTKRESSKKPTLETMFRSMVCLAALMKQHEVTNLAIPRIGCGLDRLEWSDVKNMLEYVFEDSGVEIVVCNFQKAEETMQNKKEDHQSRKCKVVDTTKSVDNIDPYTLILYIGYEDLHVDDTLRALDQRFDLLRDYEKEKKRAGEFILSYKQNYKYALYGCIVNQKHTQGVNYEHLGKCLREINKQNVKLAKKGENFTYVAIQEVKDPNDDMASSKIRNLLRNTFYNVEIYVCSGRL